MITIAHLTRNFLPEGSADDDFRLAVEACPNGMAITDGMGTIMLVNAAIERLFGYRRDELLGETITTLLPEQQRSGYLQHCAEFARHPYSRQPDKVRTLLGRRSNSSEFPIEIGLYPIDSGDGLRVLNIIVDVSERTRMDRLKDEFVSTVSHELRTPLTSIAGSLGLLIGGAAGTLPEPVARLIRIAQSNSQRLVRLINDILDIEKIESGQVAFKCRRLDARPLVEQVIEANRGYADGFHVRVRLDAYASSAEVYADPDRLAQVMTNLLSNAIKFSPADGEVTVTISVRGDSVRLAVRDHGPGIPREFRPRIFEKFAQADATDARQKGGTGLGLSIVKQIVDRLSGTVGFEDADGGGTVFYVDLPSWVQAAREIDARDAAVRPQILHIDDDHDVLELVAQTLASTANVVSVDSIEEARYALLTHQFDLAIVDITLGSVSGLDLLPELRNRDDALIPVIIFSGHTVALNGNPQVAAKLSKASAAALKDLIGAVHDRLSLRPARIRNAAL